MREIIGLDDRSVERICGSQADESSAVGLQITGMERKSVSIKRISSVVLCESWKKVKLDVGTSKVGISLEGGLW